MNCKVIQKEGKILQILNDFVLKEDICNMSCDYCLTEGAVLKEKHNFKRINGKLNFTITNGNHSLIYEEGNPIKENIDCVLKVYNTYFNAPILKISGGEVFLIKKLTNFLQNESGHYEVIQVLTNGLLIDDEIRGKLKEISNLNIQLSMDGHTIEMNKCRIKNEKNQNKILAILDKLIKIGIDTEIYCVLTYQNIETINKYIEYLYFNYDKQIHLTFFPVRQKAAKKFFPHKEQLFGLKQVLNKYSKFETILPPYLYIEGIYKYLLSKRRKTRCYVPLTMFQNFDDGIVTPCPNCWTIQIGNLIESPEKVLQSYFSHRIYESMTSLPPLTFLCLKCFTDYHVFNYYYDDLITLDELTRTRPLLQGKLVRKRLQEIKLVLNKLFV